MNIAEAFSRIPLGSKIAFLVFIAISITELVFAFLELETPRRMVKPFCLFSLMIAIIIAIPNNPLVYLGAFFGMLGDIVIMGKFKGSFEGGAALFFAGHVCYITAGFLYVAKGNVPWFNIVVFVIFFIVAFLVGFIMVFRKHFNRMFTKLGASLYYATICTMLIMMVFFTSKSNPLMFFGIIGMASFIVSDILLFSFKVKTPPKRYDFYIMLTYLIAQAGIALGFVFSLI